MFFEERMELIESKLDRIIELLEKNGVNIASQEQLMSAQDIAEMYGISKQRIYANYRHLLPLFGEEMKNGRGARWKRKDVLDWNELSMVEKERKLAEHLKPSPSGETKRRRGRPRKNSETI